MSDFLNKINHLANNLVEDKYKRAQSCVEYLSDIMQICNIGTEKHFWYGKQVEFGIRRFDPINENYENYCRSELALKGFVDCRALEVKGDVIGDASDAKEL